MIADDEGGESTDLFDEVEAALAGAEAVTVNDPEPAGYALPTNYVAEQELHGKDGQQQTRTVLKPRRSAEILSDCVRRTGGWPRAVGGVLFVEEFDGTPRFLNTAVKLFAWFDELGPVDWVRGSKFVTQERFFEFARARAEAFEAIETGPHWPLMPGAYYMHPPLPAATGKALASLLACFEPATDLDAQLLKAAVMTPAWGGQPGSRPAFPITGAEDTSQQGRGIGKSVLVNLVANLYGGYLDVKPISDIKDVKTRLLSAEGRSRRIARLDNVKTLKLSWADLEGLITADVISGRQLYQGEGRRPNTLTWFITINGASFSKDMAQRAVLIELARPDYQSHWEQRVLAYLDSHRLEILADVGEILGSPVPPLGATTRGGAWEQGVLAHVDCVVQCQGLILERQELIDDDERDRGLVRAHFRHRLQTSCKINPDNHRVFIESGRAAQLLSEAMQKPFATNTSTTFIKNLGLPELQHTELSGRPRFRWQGLA